MIDQCGKNKRQAKGLGVKRGYEAEPAVGASPIGLALSTGLTVQFLDLQRGAEAAQHCGVVLDH